MIDSRTRLLEVWLVGYMGTRDPRDLGPQE